MHLGRRLIAFSLNLLLLHLAWTGSRGECSPGNARQHQTAAMGSMQSANVPAPHEPMDRGSHRDCSGDMLSGDCASMSGCATATLFAAIPSSGLIPMPPDMPRALIPPLTAVGAFAPLPPPPRA